MGGRVDTAADLEAWETKPVLSPPRGGAKNISVLQLVKYAPDVLRGLKSIAKLKPSCAVGKKRILRNKISLRTLLFLLTVSRLKSDDTFFMKPSCWRRFRRLVILSSPGF